MIIWLASYPKSGNTWVRSMIAALIHSNDGVFNFELLKNIQQFPEKKFFKDIINDFSNFNEIKQNWIEAQERINLNNKINLFKTHQGKYTVGEHNFTNNDNTLGVIYVVRDPRNLIKSISNHFTLDLEKSYHFLTSSEIIGNGKSWSERQDGMYNLLGSWNDHYRSWTRVKDNLLLVKYENLILDPKNELLKIIKFLKQFINFETNENKNNKILETTSFENLKSMENKGLFKENVLNKETKSKVDFFHLGPENNWQNLLDEKMAEDIEKKFKNEMKELEYID